MRVAILVAAIYIFQFSAMAQASEEHWAQQEIRKMKVIYGVDFHGSPDASAEYALQEKLWKLTGADLTPARELHRFSVIRSLTDMLQIEEACEEEVPTQLTEFKDVCDY